MFFDRFTQRLFPTKWGNKVSKWLNNVVGDGYIKVYSPDAPSPENPPRIRLDFDTLVASLQNAGLGGGGALQPNTYSNGANATEKLANAQALAGQAPVADAIVNDVETSSNTKQVIADAAVARIGTSSNAAREDHQHPSPLRSTTTTNFTSAQLTNLAGNAPKACKQVTSTETNAQKVARMGTSTYAAREDHEHPSELRSLSDAVATLASHAPVAPQIVSTSETNAQKKTRLGTSTYAAREDHVHPVPNDSTTPTGLNTGWRNQDSTDSGTSAKTDTWTRSSATTGVKLKVITRTWANRGDVFFLWRELTFDKFGALVSVGAESFGDYCMGGF